jgi:pyruvate/2-oxoglutarate/acetoin dehydrogenase E1 component
MTATRLPGHEALNRVLHSELAADRRLLVIGETVRMAGSTRTVLRGLHDRFGPGQVIETPVSENGIFGAALGLALSGYRPVVEIYTADFLLVVANEIMGDMAKWRQQQARPGPLPIVIRGCMGPAFGGSLGAEHSQSMEAFFHHQPGIVIVAPGTPRDMAGLLRAALRSPDPVLFLEHRRTYELVGEVPDDESFMIKLGTAEVVRQGDDITLVAWSWMRSEAERAARTLEGEGIFVELIDPRTIRPMDHDVIARSAARTGRLLVVEEGTRTGGVAAEVIARAIETATNPLRVARCTTPDVILPYSPSLELPLYPSATTIADAVRRLVVSDRLSVGQGELRTPSEECFLR